LLLVQQEAIMVVDERSRHELYRRLEEVLGPEAATTLIEHLPPVGWADVATKHDLAGLEQRLELRFDRIDDRFALNEERTKAAVSEVRATLEHELRSQSTTMIFGLVGIILTMAALAVALIRLT
jgi:hypothetical protein